MEDTNGRLEDVAVSVNIGLISGGEGRMEGWMDNS